MLKVILLLFVTVAVVLTEVNGQDDEAGETGRFLGTILTKRYYHGLNSNRTEFLLYLHVPQGTECISLFLHYLTTSKLS